jgi:undecaprenyl diphosphate synthase
MDGNGRWAQARGLPRTMGHRKGAEALKSLLKTCLASGIRYLTVYAFSSENWSRPAEEVSDLMGLLQIYIEQELALLKKHHIRLRVIGDLSRCSKGMAQKITQACEETSGFTALNLTIALSYGSRQEIARALRRIAAEGIPAEQIDESLIASRLDTHDLPDPDLLIRTGGDQRLSNFLLWQSAYAELYFTPTLWPDFGENDLKAALDEYTQRERRFGTVANR